MQLHTIFNMKMQCNVFLPRVLLPRRQFQRLKYSVFPSVYTDSLIFTRKNRLIITTYCLYCRTNRLRWTNRLGRLVRLGINTAIKGTSCKIMCADNIKLWWRKYVLNEASFLSSHVLGSFAQSVWIRTSVLWISSQRLFTGFHLINV